jgi:EAL domain-containing protein (putative c-di-GMP-specific phosphodiesterase class I)
MSIVAEGIERSEQADVPQGLGCTEAHGFLFGRPLPYGELLDLLRDTGGQAGGRE